MPHEFQIGDRVATMGSDGRTEAVGEVVLAGEAGIVVRIEFAIDRASERATYRIEPERLQRLAEPLSYFQAACECLDRERLEALDIAGDLLEEMNPGELLKVLRLLALTRRIAEQAPEFVFGRRNNYARARCTP
jgi:hypothetical protein